MASRIVRCSRITFNPKQPRFAVKRTYVLNPLSLRALKKAVRALGFKSAGEYRSRFREIPRSPSNPDKSYKGKGWRGWVDLLGYVYYHGEGSRSTPEYSTWNSMLARCFDPLATGYDRYGGAHPPVVACERWRDYRNFLIDMGRRPTIKHTLGRFGDAGNYEPGNCAWQMPQEQSAEQKKKRGNKCNRGLHEFTPENTYINPKTKRRYCRVCKNEAVRRRKENQNEPGLRRHFNL